MFKAEKGKTTVIIYKQDYHNKVHTFLLENNFQHLPKNPTKKDQTHISKTLQQCNLVVHKKQIKYLIQKNPSPPTLKAQLKLHKPAVPIRPVVNSRTAPSYSVAKKLNEILKQRLNMDNSYTIDNSTKLAHDLTKLTISDSHRLIDLDIRDLYVNIPITETIDIARAQLLKQNNNNITEQICTLLEMVLQQNYLEFQAQIYQLTPISGITAEIFLRNLEQSHLNLLLDSKHITFYARYVDDILIIYDASRNNLDAITQYAVCIHHSLQFNPTLESYDWINFLDLSIIRKPPN